MSSEAIFRKKFFAFTINIMIFMIFSIGIFMIPIHASGSTSVKVNPLSQTISSGSSFTIDILCTPTQSIKSYELEVIFNPSLLKVNSVSKGNIFNGHSTYFNAGTIDNTVGTIENIYNCILGTATVSSSGTLITISLTAKSTSGTSSIKLNKVGITNDVGYISITTTNGSVQVTPVSTLFIFSNLNPSKGASNIPISTSEITLTVQNSKGHAFDYYIKTNPDVGTKSKTYVNNGTKSCNLSGLTYDTTYYWYLSCKDLSNGQWVNQTYTFTTKSNPTNDQTPSDGGGGTSSNGDELSSTPIFNNPPNPPTKPEGPTFIEPDVTYYYTSSAFDLDKDTIRLRFNWGDGTYSNWTVYIPSDTKKSLSHTWKNVSSYNISVIAQDEHGINSSLSDNLIVTISQEEQAVVEIITSPSNISTNETIYFSASNCFIPGGNITSYYWEFGDGKTSNFKKTVNTFTKPGQYIINLTITDNLGATYTKKIFIDVGSDVQVKAQNKADFMPIILTSGTIGIIIALIFFIILFFRELRKDKLFKISITHGRKWIKGFITGLNGIKHQIYTRLKPTGKVIIVEQNKPINIPLHYSYGERSNNKIDDIELAYIRNWLDGITIE